MGTQKPNPSNSDTDTDSDETNKVFVQGSLDNLCGIYTIVNALHYLGMIASDEDNTMATGLFRELIGDNFQTYMEDGIYASKNKGMNYLIKGIQKGSLGPKSAKFMEDQKDRLSLTNLAVNEERRENNGLGCILEALTSQNIVAIVRMAEEKNYKGHWACLVGYDEEYLYFLDSDADKADAEVTEGTKKGHAPKYWNWQEKRSQVVASAVVALHDMSGIPDDGYKIFHRGSQRDVFILERAK